MLKFWFPSFELAPYGECGSEDVGKGRGREGKGWGNSGEKVGVYVCVGGRLYTFVFRIEKKMWSILLALFPHHSPTKAPTQTQIHLYIP